MAEKQKDTKSIDLVEIINQFCNNFKTVKDLRKKADVKHVREEDIDFSKLKIKHKPAKYTGINEAAPVVKSQLLFSSVLTNDTSSAQKLTLSSSKKTTSTCRISLQKALSFGSNFSVTVSPPATPISSSVGFTRNVSLTSTAEESTQEETTWAVNSEINVAAKCRTTATINIEEAELSGDFTVDTIISGRLFIDIRDSKTGDVLAPLVIKDVSQIFTESDGFQPVPDRAGVVCFTQRGHIDCRFGFNQSVRFQEEPLMCQD